MTSGAARGCVVIEAWSTFAVGTLGESGAEYLVTAAHR
jgi:hypothetical protein